LRQKKKPTKKSAEQTNEQKKKRKELEAKKKTHKKNPKKTTKTTIRVMGGGTGKKDQSKGEPFHFAALGKTNSQPSNRGKEKIKWCGRVLCGSRQNATLVTN